MAPDIASIISDGKARPGAEAEEDHRRQDVGDVGGVDGGPREQQEPDDDQDEARDQVARAPNRMLSFAEKPSESAPISTATGRKARPTSSAS